MLKQKSLEDFNCASSEQLFIELTPEQGASISGGFDYKLRNSTDIAVNATINGQGIGIQPSSDFLYQSNSDQVIITYNDIIGPGYNVTSKVLTEGDYFFTRGGNKLFLGSRSISQPKSIPQLKSIPQPRKASANAFRGMFY